MNAICPQCNSTATFDDHIDNGYGLDVARSYFCDNETCGNYFYVLYSLEEMDKSYQDYADKGQTVVVWVESCSERIEGFPHKNNNKRYMGTNATFMHVDGMGKTLNIKKVSLNFLSSVRFGISKFEMSMSDITPNALIAMNGDENRLITMVSDWLAEIGKANLTPYFQIIGETFHDKSWFNNQFV